MKMVDTAAGEILVERIFDAWEDDFDCQQSLIRIYQMQYRDATNASQDAADAYINAALDADKIAFT
jgi:hypothetical protein